MEDTKLQKSSEVVVEQQQQAQQKKEVGDLLQKYGGFSAIKGIIPAAEDMNPAKKAIKESFLTDSRKKAKQELLATKLRA